MFVGFIELKCVKNDELLVNLLYVVYVVGRFIVVVEMTVLFKPT